ncbi:permease [Psychrilyobacter atlanticus]|uniref:permease n=1 Tax=Psychrilyobacter atlanticus TaxID=271091 RepID=UPI0003F6A265|nr:permease [Psychrilyobacter atlanticus]
MWKFLTDTIWAKLIEGILGLSLESRVGEVAWYFLHAASTILILLGLGIFIISILRTFISTEKIKKFIESHKGIKSNVMASVLGVITPFCSCSSVPIFIGFIEAGIPTGVVFSFLITSPIVNEAAFLILMTIFGWKVATIYAISGIVIGVLGGMLIGKLKMEKYIEGYIYKMHLEGKKEKIYRGRERLTYAWKETKDVVIKLIPYMIVGIGIGAFIHGWVPTDLLSKYGGKDNFFAVPIATLVAIPLYTDAAGIIPVAEALITKGVGIGTTMAFMMAAVALSLPEMLLLKKVIKLPLIATFVGIVGTGIIAVGYLFNYIA